MTEQTKERFFTEDEVRMIVRDEIAKVGVKPRIQRKRWSAADKRLLLKMTADGDSVNDCAAHFGVTLGAVVSRLWDLGVK